METTVVRITFGLLLSAIRLARANGATKPASLMVDVDTACGLRTLEVRSVHWHSDGASDAQRECVMLHVTPAPTVTACHELQRPSSRYQSRLRVRVPWGWVLSQLMRLDMCCRVLRLLRDATAAAPDPSGDGRVRCWRGAPGLRAHELVRAHLHYGCAAQLERSMQDVPGPIT